jgi:CDP-4-dehydro-6-deoxyglucose reductase, E3
MQHPAGKPDHALQRVRAIEIASHRHSAGGAPGSMLRRIAQQYEYPEFSEQPGQGAAGDIAAADDQQVLHGNILADPCGKPGSQMNHRIKVQPAGHEFAAEADESILAAALRQGLTMPYGCKDGACGACKGKVLAGSVELGYYQPSALSDAERAAGLTLYCCAQARSDLEIECKQMIRAGDIPVKTMPARIEVMERPAADVIVLKLRLPASEEFRFLAGQYIDILLKDGKRRSYSLASAPHQQGILDLHIRHVPGGLFTEQVFTTMKARDILRFEGPHGGFFLREDSDKPLILLASGTGFAPVKALVEHMLAQGMQRPVDLYWGARRRADLYMNDLPAAWAAAHPHIRYTPVLSEATVEDAWDGRTGFVHLAVIADHPDLAGFQVYACGAPPMIDAARRDFTAQCGLPAEEFFADAFTFSAPGK